MQQLGEEVWMSHLRGGVNTSKSCYFFLIKRMQECIVEILRQNTFHNDAPRFAAFLKIWPLTILRFMPFFLRTNFRMSSKSLALGYIEM